MKEIEKAKSYVSGLVIGGLITLFIMYSIPSIPKYIYEAKRPPFVQKNFDNLVMNARFENSEEAITILNHFIKNPPENFQNFERIYIVKSIIKDDVAYLVLKDIESGKLGGNYLYVIDDATGLVSKRVPFSSGKKD